MQCPLFHYLVQESICSDNTLPEIASGKLPGQRKLYGFYQGLKILPNTWKGMLCRANKNFVNETKEVRLTDFSVNVNKRQANG